MTEKFELVSKYKPTGDQPQAIEKIIKALNDGQKSQILLGVTGSGKTFTMANVISAVNRTALILAPNKTLAAQLFSEFRELFPNNAVEYFVSYYDYYQPEAYLPKNDTYIEKDADINERIDKLRHSATVSLLERNDVVIVASVSCIYGLGSPEAYHDMILYLERGLEVERNKALRKLTDIQYKRKDFAFERGSFRVRGDVLDIFPVYEDSKIIRAEFFGDEIESIYEVDPLTGEILREMSKVTIYPASHYVVQEEKLEKACEAIEAELDERIEYYEQLQKPLELQRIKQRTEYDLELIRNIGYCSGIENYSRHLEGRQPGSTPATLMHYLPQDALIFIDESHITVPQLNGMYRGDRSRKETLVKHGFRLPSALDNRPLMFDEFEKIVNMKDRQITFVSATPGNYEMEKSEMKVTEQIIRPTGLTDPDIEVKPTEGQIDDLYDEIKSRIDKNERVLVTTLTKRMSEELSEYFYDRGLRAKYLHSDIETIERSEILKDLRLGKFDVLIGINLLREGLDLPEVSLVAILDADKEGFLRSARSLIQTFGRAARNINGKVIMYADKVTRSMKYAIEETDRRRKVQDQYNRDNNITPMTIIKEITEGIGAFTDSDYVDTNIEGLNRINDILAKADAPKHRKQHASRRKAEEHLDDKFTKEDVVRRMKFLKAEMQKHAKKLEFEKAAVMRDEMLELERLMLDLF